jgi:sulfide:quinone oxidoreductase
VIVGGGVGGLEAALALRELAPDVVDVELVSSELHFFYRPLAVVEPFGLGSVHRWELGELAHRAGARFSPGTLTAVDVERRVARLASGGEIEYDALLLALGAKPETAVPGALTFRGQADVESFRLVLEEAKLKGGGRLVFAVPSGPVWPLPIYELALLTAFEFEEDGLAVDISIVTSEPSPLALFGSTASDAVSSMLAERGVTVTASTYSAAFEQGRLLGVPDRSIHADWVVACPRLAGPDIPGVPRERNGFIPIDEYGCVPAVDRLYAAGDATTFPVKQGGIAAAQADAAARSIAAHAGADVEQRPFRPLLRALLVSKERPAFMRVELGGGHGDSSTVSEEALWWPPGKIVGRYLSPFLAGLGVADLCEGDGDVVRLEIHGAGVDALSGS